MSISADLLHLKDLAPVTGAPRLFTIPPGASFVDLLAQSLLDRAASDPMDLAATLILVPTRRAARSLREAFLRRAGGRSILLPRLRPLGDADEEELGLNAGEAVLNLAPAVDPLTRQFLLARLVMAWWRARGEAADVGAALAHAGELARLIDEVEIEGADWRKLDTIVPDALARHWQETLDFLKLAARDYWPAIRDEYGAMDPAGRRNQLILLQAEYWRATPPQHPVIVAGSTGSIPATAHLMSMVARLPRGAVILPGLDLAMDETAWNLLDPSHPQWTMRELLGRMRATRADVGAWPDGTVPAAPTPRAALLAQALAPAATTERWSQLALDLDAGLAGVTRIEAPDSPAEARAIALMMREVLETPAASAMLVTPDRNLARRVAAELARWQIEIDDSAGRPLSATVPGAFLRLVLAMVASGFAPLELLSCLKHPVACAGLDRGAFLRRLRRLERRLLRGPRPASGLGALRDLAAQQKNPDDLTDLIDRLDAACAPLVTALAAGESDLQALVNTHIACAEALSDDEVLWRGEAGKAAADLVQDLLAGAATLGPIPADDYPGLFDTLAAGVSVRPRHGLHPRLHILGPQEARLQTADLVILGSLNEGAWPAEPSPDPWISRAMRAELGLAPADRRLGQSAHDFLSLAASPRVVLSRAAKVDLSPTVPSRWLRRLDALVGSGRWQAADAQRWALSLDPPLDHPRPEPEPRPPVSARPDRFSVSDIELLVRDPYALYAKRVLRLKPLDPIDQPPGANDRGNIIHEVLDQFIGAHKTGPLPADAADQLIDLGRRAFAAFDDYPVVKRFWWPRFVDVVRWFVETEAGRRAEGTFPLAVETDAELPIEAGGRDHTVTARADRIDRLADGSAVIIDYKTGMAPSKAQMEAGYRPQLPLEAAMVAAGAFTQIGEYPIGLIEVWQMKGGSPAGTIKPIAGAASIADGAIDGVTRLLAKYATQQQPYLSSPNPHQAGYGDYDHLARVGEWSDGGDGT